MIELLLTAQRRLQKEGYTIISPSGYVLSAIDPKHNATIYLFNTEFEIIQSQGKLRGKSIDRILAHIENDSSFQFPLRMNGFDFVVKCLTTEQYRKISQPYFQGSTYGNLKKSILDISENTCQNQYSE